MKSKTFAQKFMPVLMLLTFLIPATLLGLVNTAWAGTASYTADDGYDASDGSAVRFTSTGGGNDIANLAASENNRMVSDGGWPTNTNNFNENRYIEFLFSPNVPTDAVITSAVITFEYQRSNSMSGAKLEVWNQSAGSSGQWVNILSGQAGFGIPGNTNSDQSYDVNVSNFITTPADANNFKFRFLTYRSGSSPLTTRHDFVSVQFDYNLPPNAPANLLLNGQPSPVNNVVAVNTFAWTFSDPDAGDAGSAYQIQISTDNTFASTVYDSGQLTGVSPQNYSGTTFEQDGATYYWRVRTWDNSGASNSGPGAWSAPAQFTMINNQPPNAPTNPAPANGEYINNANPIFSWSTFSDPDAGNTQSHFQIQLRLQAGSYGGSGSHDFTSGTSTANSYTPTTWNLTNGTTYCWHVRVQDNFSAWSNYSTETCFTEDRTAPTSSAASPATTNVSPFSVTATATDGGSGVANVRLYFRGPTGSWAQTGAQINAPGTFQWNFTPTANGTYYFQSVACDSAGNCQTPPSGTGGTGNTQTVYDNVPPTSAATPPAGPINSGSVAIPWTASDATSGIAANGVTLYYNYNGGAYSADGTASGTSGTFDFTAASGDGTYCFYTRAADNAGNVEAAPATNDGCTVFKNKATIGDRVWLDANGNGVQDGGEAGINGVTLTLFQGTTVVSTTTTAGDGNYLFRNLTGAAIRTVRDNFSTASYANNDGTTTWTGNWIETDSGGNGATGGNVLVAGGELNIDTGGSNIYRQVDLAGNSSAVLTFNFRTSGSPVDSSDAINLEISNDGGSNWTQLEQFLGNYSPSYSGSRTYDIGAYMAANTRIRFAIPSGSYNGSNETFYIDNIQIQFQNAAQGTYTVTVDASNLNPGGALFGYQPTDGLAAVSPLVVFVGAGEDVTSADFGYGSFALIGDLIYQDNNRNNAVDAGEPGLPNITVWLYSDGNGNGKIDGSDAIIRTTSTNAGGGYYFGGINPGSYLVLADAADPDLPGGFRPTGPNPAAVTGVIAGSAYLNTDIGFNTPPPMTKELYLRTPTDLTRNRPTGLTPSTVTILSSEALHDHSVTWQMPASQALAGPLTFVSGQPVQAILRIQSNRSTSALACGGQLPDVTVTLSVVGGPVLSTAIINDMPDGLNTRTFNLNIPAGTTLAANSRLQLKIDASGADCSLNYPNLQLEDADGYIVVYFDSLTDLSHVALPVVSYIHVDQDGTYDAAYPGGAPTPTFIQGDTVYVRATTSDPFGAFDISGMTISIPNVVTNTAMTQVASGTLTKTFELARPGLLGGNYSYIITATEGTEGQITAVATGTFQVIVSNLGSSIKTVDKATAVPGDVLTYTIVLSNTGGLNATVKMTDTLPANVTHLSGPTGPAGATWSPALNAILFTGPVTANSRVVITHSVTVASPLDNGTVIANNATIDDGFSKFDTSPPATTVITSTPNLVTSVKTVDRASAAPGDSLIYTIILTNTGKMNAYVSSGLPLLDTIPANTAFDGGLFASAGNISYNPGFNRIEWYGTVPASGSVTLRHRVKVATPLDNGTVITNTAIINEGGGFPTPQTYTRTVTTTIVASPVLTSTSAKLVDKALAAPGDSLAYTIILKNNGNMNAPGVVLTDTLPAQVAWGGDAFLSATSGTAQFITATNTVLWTGDVNAGATVQILFRATTATPLPNNTQIVNVARVSDGAGNFTPFNLQAITTIQSVPNLNTSTKTVNTLSAVPGDVLTYTIRLVNTGNAVADTSVLDNLPAQLQNPVIVSASSGQAQVSGGNAIVWTGQVTPTQPVTITFRATLLSVLNNGIQVSNTAQVNDGVNTPFFISPPAVTTISSSPSLTTSRKTVNLDTASPNDLLIYTITLTNTGNMVANAQVLDTLPPNVTFNGGLSASAGAPLPTYSSINNRISWQGSVTPGAPVSISYQVRINTPLDNNTVILNDAQISDGVNPFFDTTPPAQTTISSAPNLSTSSKAVDLATASPGDLLHYTIRLVNSGSMIASGTTISDTLPAQVTISSGPFVSGGGAGGYNPSQRRIFWSGSVAPGTDVIVEYYATINSPLTNGTQIVNDAVIQGSFGTITTNAVTTTVQSDHQLTLNKTAPTIVGAGQAMTYTLAYNVTGNEPAPTVVITDTLPANTTFGSCAPAPCGLGAGNVISWTLGTLNPGNASAVTLRVNVTSPLPNGTVITNTAFIFDTDTGADQSSATTTVTSGHGFSLTKRDTGYDPVQAGGQIVYSLDWAVSGAETPVGVVITDAVPINTTYLSCGGAACTQNSGVITWTLNNPAPGSAGTVVMTVTVANPLPNGTILTNQARISDSNGGVAATATEQTTVNSSHSLDVAKIAPASVSAGGQITYSIAYTVSGNEPALNVVIEDNTPVNTTFASAAGAASINNPGAGNSGLVRWNLGNRPPGTTGVVTLTVNVANPLPNGTLINNSVSIRDSNGGATDVDTASTTVNSSHGFTLTKSDTPDPVLPGSIINYTIHWAVTGNELAQNVTITDAIPANTAFFGCGGCSQQGSFVQWNLGNHSPGESGDVTLQVQVNSPLPNGTTITNTARIFDGNGGAPVSASTTTSVNSGHQLTLSKSAPSIVQAGQIINYTLNWAVTGNEGANGVVITDAIPANTTFVPGSCTGCSVAGNIVTWSLGDLVPGNSGALALAVTAGNLLPNGTIITNTARIRDASGLAVLASASTTVSSGHGFNLTKSDGADPVQAGDLLTYTIGWSVIGTEQALNVVISDTLPANTSYSSCSPTPCGLNAGNVVTWSLGPRNPNTSGSVSLTVNVAPALANGTILSNQARIADSNGGIAATSNIEQTTVNASHRLTVAKLAPASVSPGGQIVYTIAYTVSGNEPALNVVIEDNTPVNTTFASAAGAASINNPGTGNSGLVRWNLPSPLNPGSTGVVTLTVNVASPLPNGTLINNSVSIRDSNNGTTGQSATTTSVNSGHTLSLTKSDTPDPVLPGSIINYTIHWAVTGNELAQNVTITDAIPANTSFFGCGGCSQQGSFVQWNLGSHSPGESGDVTLQVQVNSPLPNGTLITNSARIFDGNGGAPVSASTTTSVNSGHQLTLSKSAPSIVQAGQTINYTLNWAVTGNEGAPGVVITDAIPANTTFVPGSCTGCSVAGNIVTWSLGDLVPGNSGALALAVTAGNLLPNGTIITNTARIRDTSGLAVLASASTTVSSGHGFNLTKADGADPVQAGDLLTYTIGWSVIGTEQALNVVISDTLPANTSYSSCSPTPCGLNAGNVVTWSLGPRNPNTSGSVSLTVNVAPALANGTLLANQARIADSNGGIAATSNIEQTTVNASHRLTVAKLAPASVNPGGQIVYTIAYTVTGNEPALNVVIEDNTPVNTTFASAAGAASINNPGAGNSGLVRWNLPSPLNPGSTGVVTLTVNVANPLPNGTLINNSVSIRDSNGGATDVDATSTTVNSSHGFTLTKSGTPDLVSPNNLINYTIHWEVTGNEPAQSVIITDAIPANTTFFSCGGCLQQGGGTYVQWNLGNANPGDSGDLTVQVRVNPLTPNGTVISNTARIRDANGGAPVSASSSATVQSSHTLTLDKRAPAAVAAGQQIIYTVDYNVVGDELAPSVVITDPIPAGTSYIANSCTGGCTVVGNVVTWDLGNLLPNTPGQVQFAVRVDNAIPNGTDISNTATVVDNSGASATDSTITRVGTDLLIDLTDNRDTVQPGEQVTYTISFSGTEPLNFGSLEIDIPDNTSFVSASGGALRSGNTLFWLITSQPAGFFGQRTILVELPPVMDNGTLISTTARIAGDGKNNRDSDSAVVVSQPNLASSVKTVSNPVAPADSLVTYQIVLSNTGNMHAHSTAITDVLPAEMTYVGPVTPTGGVAGYVGSEVRWNGQVQVGTPVTITFEARVNAGVSDGTIIENVVDINDGFHPDLLQKSAVIAVRNPAPGSGNIYLPLLMKANTAPAPTEPTVELTILNCGDTNAVGAFWVDLYFNPNEQSIFWPINHGEGYDWFGQGAGFTVSTLGPGQSINLYLDDAVIKNMPNPLPASARLYAQVDLFDKTTPGAGVVDEGSGGEANNVAGSGGSTCSATPGKPDLIVTGIRLLNTSSTEKQTVIQPAQTDGVKPAPARLQPPQQ